MAMSITKRLGVGAPALTVIGCVSFSDARIDPPSPVDRNAMVR